MLSRCGMKGGHLAQQLNTAVGKLIMYSPTLTSAQCITARSYSGLTYTFNVVQWRAATAVFQVFRIQIAKGTKGKHSCES